MPSRCFQLVCFFLSICISRVYRGSRSKAIFVFGVSEELILVLLVRRRREGPRSCSLIVTPARSRGTGPVHYAHVLVILMYLFPDVLSPHWQLGSNSEARRPFFLSSFQGSCIHRRFSA